MKISIIEPLGISEDTVAALKKEMLPTDIELVYYNTPAINDEEKIKRAKGAQIVILANTPFRQSVLTQCPDLKLISVAFTGVDHVDMDYCKTHGITVSNCSGYANEAVSELVFGLVIDLYRSIFAADAAVRSSKTKAGLAQYELYGKKFGIIGAGAIGLKTASLAKAFGCKVYAYSRTTKNIDGIEFINLEKLLTICDIISVHVPLTNSTRNLLNAENIKLMKPSAILINTARGPIVNADDLTKALKNGYLAGAAIDVFDYEPPIKSSENILSAPNVVLTPHIGFATQEAMQKRAVIAFTNIAKWFSGKPQNVM